MTDVIVRAGHNVRPASQTSSKFRPELADWEKKHRLTVILNDSGSTATHGVANGAWLAPPPCLRRT